VDRGWCTSAVELAGGGEKAAAAQPEAGRGRKVDVVARRNRGPEALPLKGGCDRGFATPRRKATRRRANTRPVGATTGTEIGCPGELVPCMDAAWGRNRRGKGHVRPAKTTVGSVAHQQENLTHPNIKSEGGTTSDKIMTHLLPILYRPILPSRHIPSPRPSGREGTLA
jgi:hypothetical protein